MLFLLCPGCEYISSLFEWKNADLRIIEYDDPLNDDKYNRLFDNNRGFYIKFRNKPILLQGTLSELKHYLGFKLFE